MDVCAGKVDEVFDALTEEEREKLASGIPGGKEICFILIRIVSWKDPLPAPAGGGSFPADGSFSAKSLRETAFPAAAFSQKPPA